ncbi:hypothetical protein H6F77_18105 [Microcoleus sp. FACHB-831]|uniref:hypothetical protein n=1 Tax=Microcoleus sp. FACHB-831 TaxID=2692827 RepID=UPI0016863B57|nr:hypothetical protein [Microcoleus sp. FACHB-831]MBD1922969.1 hypothetical protein [Microcoleus sp. FACHB-831]
MPNQLIIHAAIAPMNSVSFVALAQLSRSQAIAPSVKMYSKLHKRLGENSAFRESEPVLGVDV